MLHRCVYYRRVPAFRPGKGYNFSHVLFDPILSVHSQREVGKFSSVAIGMASETIATYMAQREVGKFSSVAIGMASETIATYMALRAGVIGQQRHSTSS